MEFILRPLHARVPLIRARSDCGPPQETASPRCAPRSNDEEQLDDAVGDRREEEEERTDGDAGGEGDTQRAQEAAGEDRREDDEAQGERPEEPLDPVCHDEHPGAPDVPFHSLEGYGGDNEQDRNGPYDPFERDQEQPADKISHYGSASAVIRYHPEYRVLYLPVRMFASGI